MDLGERPGSPSLRNLERVLRLKNIVRGGSGDPGKGGGGEGVDWDLHEAGRSLRNAPGLSRGGEPAKGAGGGARGGGAAGRARAGREAEPGAGGCWRAAPTAP